MSKELNIQETMNTLTNQYAHKLADMEDSAVYAYLKCAIDLLSYAGKDVTQYAMIRVQNPMEYKKNGITVSSQWRIVPITDLENLPVYDE
jgi:hypothetical protein